MSKLFRHIIDCAESHAEHGDNRGAAAIAYSAENGKGKAERAFPDCRPAIDNAWRFARQETGA